MYADNITKSIKNAVNETNRRRRLQINYNKKNNIIPKTISKNISDILYASGIRSKVKTKKSYEVKDRKEKFEKEKLLDMDLSKIDSIISGLEEEMNLAAKELNFERAAIIRDEIKRIKKILNIDTKKIK